MTRFSITYGTFLFFGCCTVLAILCAWLFVPETKGVQLEDMDLLFGPDVSIRASKARESYLEARDARATMGNRLEEKHEALAEVEHV